MSDIYKDVSDERKAMTFSVDHDDPIRNSYLEMMWNPSTSEPVTSVWVLRWIIWSSW